MRSGFLEHLGSDVFCHEVGAAKIDVEDGVPCLFVEIFEGDRGADEDAGEVA